MDPVSQATISAFVLFGVFGVVLWGWLMRRLRYGWVDLAMDPKGFLSMLLVVCVATALFGLMLIEALRQLVIYLTSRPLLLGALGLIAAGVLYAIRRRRQHRGWDGV